MPTYLAGPVPTYLLLTRKRSVVAFAVAWPAVQTAFVASSCTWSANTANRLSLSLISFMCLGYEDLAAHAYAKWVLGVAILCCAGGLAIAHHLAGGTVCGSLPRRKHASALVAASAWLLILNIFAPSWRLTIFF